MRGMGIEPTTRVEGVSMPGGSTPRSPHQLNFPPHHPRRLSRCAARGNHSGRGVCVVQIHRFLSGYDHVRRIGYDHVLHIVYSKGKLRHQHVSLLGKTIAKVSSGTNTSTHLQDNYLQCKGWAQTHVPSSKNCP